jgi:Fur family transcriptional regulator, ferric uptake regulator
VQEHFAMTDTPTLTAANILDALAQQGNRTTRPRQAIAAAIAARADAESDFAIDDLWQDARRCDAGVGRATTFRLVDLLVRLGMLDRIAFADGTERYHAVAPGAHHHHLTCARCHKIVEIDCCLPMQQIAEMAQRNGFALAQHRIEIFGLCSECQ